MENAPYYSQYGEDRILDWLFRGTRGTCVEVGGNDGATFSTTLYFEKAGWETILVEPIPELGERIRASRRGRLFNCAASDKAGRAVLSIPASGDVYASLEANPTMSAMMKDPAAVKAVEVETRTLDSMLEEAGVSSIEFITIDVEGHETQVLKGFDLERWRPAVVIVEDAADFGETPVRAHMRRKGYRRVYRSGGNDWYVRDRGSPLANPIAATRIPGVEARGIAKARLPQGLLALLLRLSRSMR